VSKDSASPKPASCVGHLTLDILEACIIFEIGTPNRHTVTSETRGKIRRIWNKHYRTELYEKRVQAVDIKFQCLVGCPCKGSANYVANGPRPICNGFTNRT